MKKLLTVFCVLVFIVSLPVDAFSKTYKIGCVKDYYPYITVGDDGELEGIIIDWWKLWSLKAEVEIEFVQLDISSCIEKTKSGEIDVCKDSRYYCFIKTLQLRLNGENFPITTKQKV